MSETNHQLDENGIPTDSDDPSASLTMIIAIITAVLVATSVLGVTGLTYWGANKADVAGQKEKVVAITELNAEQSANLQRSGTEIIDGKPVSRKPISEAKQIIIQRHGKK